MTEHLDRGEVFSTDGWGSENNDYLTDDVLDYEEDDWYDPDDPWVELEGDDEEWQYDDYLYND